MAEASSKNVFIGIGVARPAGMTPLPGVTESLDAMAGWATRQGYVAVLTITDDESAVTAERIREVITPLLSPPPHRIVIYFVGHGFLDPPDQVWVLSDGPEVNTGRVSRNALRASLSTYQPTQIAIISDACLTAREFRSGTVPVLFDRPGPRRQVFVDNIFSTLPNNPSYFFRPEGDDGAFCLFTSVLLDFLQGTHPDCFRLPTGVCQDVTTQTLLWNLPEAVRRRAADLNVDQEGRIEPGFPVGMDTYSRFPTDASIDDRGRTDSGSQDQATSPKETQEPASFEKRLAEYQPDPPPLMQASQLAETFKLFGRSSMVPVALVHHSASNPRFDGGPLDPCPGSDTLWTVVQRIGGDGSDGMPDSIWHAVGQYPSYDGRNHTRLIRIHWYSEQQELLAMVPLFPDLVATVHITEGRTGSASADGCYQLSWEPLNSTQYDDHAYSAKTVLSWRFLNALNNGKLSSGDARLMAHAMRDEKHINPIIGVVCAYLYDLVGDVNSIVRMCHYYNEENQYVPFDIALLSGGEIRRGDDDGWEVSYPAAPCETPMKPDYLWMKTQAGVARIAGAAPLLRVGWNRLQSLASPDRDILARLGALSSSLTPTPIATLKGRESIEYARQLLQELAFP